MMNTLEVSAAFVPEEGQPATPADKAKAVAGQRKTSPFMVAQGEGARWSQGSLEATEEIQSKCREVDFGC